MSIKVLLVNGSPNKEGCTYTALSEIALALKQENILAEIFWIGNKPVGGCLGCGKCAETGKCITGDVVNEFRAKLSEADGFVFGTPVHFASGSGNMTGFMDRVFFSELCSGSANLRLKPTAVITSARRAGTTATFDQINKYFTILEMPIVSARYWNMVHGQGPADVLKDEEGLATMRELAGNMAFLLRCIEEGRKAGVKAPVHGEKPYTNFIR